MRDKHTRQTHVTNCVTYFCIVPVKHKHAQQTHVTNKYDISLHCVSFRKHTRHKAIVFFALIAWLSQQELCGQTIFASVTLIIVTKSATVAQDEVTNCDRMCERNVITALCNENCNCCTKCSRHKFSENCRIVITALCNKNCHRNVITALCNRPCCFH